MWLNINRGVYFPLNLFSPKVEDEKFLRLRIIWSASRKLMVIDGTSQEEWNQDHLLLLWVGQACCWVKLGCDNPSWISRYLPANCISRWQIISTKLSFSGQKERLLTSVLVWLLKVTYILKNYLYIFLISGSQWLLTRVLLSPDLLRTSCCCRFVY